LSNSFWESKVNLLKYRTPQNKGLAGDLDWGKYRANTLRFPGLGNWVKLAASAKNTLVPKPDARLTHTS
jgi:hypothetical protein